MPSLVFIQRGIEGEICHKKSGEESLSDRLGGCLSPNNATAIESQIAVGSIDKSILKIAYSILRILKK